MAPKLLDINHQLVFYGAYHSNKYNIAIHLVGVPLILWSGLLMGYSIPTPSFFPQIHYDFGQYFSFEFNWPFLWALSNLTYYIALQPIAGLLYAPIMSFLLLSATSLAQQPGGFDIGLWAHGIAWVSQFIGHGVAEKRAPALLDNIVGALVLAPYFVHFEILFFLGLFPQLHKQMVNGVGVEIAKFRREEAEKKRKAT